MRDLLFWIFLLLSESWLLKITKIIFILFNVLLTLILSLFCYALFCVHSSFAIVLMGKRELVALLSLSSWCLVIVVWLFLAVPWVGLQCIIVVFPDHTHLPFSNERADLLALVCGVYCEFVTFPLVSWVRCGTWLYRFLIFAHLLTFIL